MDNIQSQSIQIIRLPKVVEICGLSRSTVYEKLNPRSRRHDPTFPKPLRLGTSAIGWLQHEIEAWLFSKKA
ncbi:MULTISPECIES: helix-turn-helix transcriptional regulator [Acinetobacter]|jgi:prophage regulatory protein|uniref:helix-turn-helix transcriptional regulator n=1 Tax=Acinetobacter TaxID=469 RepID=UPI000A34BB68|nr:MULTISPECIES: AlpA family phage regulatory protein [Acinetobacter]MDH1799302.1 AlpA family phage regulatory protein [Acinetobacter johnsonii]OTG59433.1 AlpA family transcriptional regulator [Acinetobacter sp. ANC 4204]WQN50473.1 AlpA family phage regulatory protein [Acinetobacter johnsonii]